MKNIKKIISVVMACLILAGVFATSSFAAGYIGKDKAKEIALNHAGITADKASFMKCEFDYDDGIAVYDVEFYFDRCEYNYEINAKNGKIKVTLLSNSRNTMLSVKDNGIGIVKDEQEKIFRRFYQTDPSHSGGGTGLGLSTVKEIALFHGGSVCVKSEPGQGSEFLVRIPTV